MLIVFTVQCVTEVSKYKINTNQKYYEKVVHIYNLVGFF